MKVPRYEKHQLIKMNIQRQTTRFSQIITGDYPRRSVWSVVGEKIHDDLRQAYHYGASVIALESLRSLAT
ncbi:MAG: hypothetical protein QXH10_09785 [Ignisphaera sp.]